MIKGIVIFYIDKCTDKKAHALFAKGNHTYKNIFKLNVIPGECLLGQVLSTNTIQKLEKGRNM